MDTRLAEPTQNDNTPKVESRNAPNRRWLIGLIAIIVLIVGAYFLRAYSGHAQLAEQNRRRAGTEAQSVPVVTAKVKTGDMDVYLSGLGTVTALNTVLSLIHI